LFCQECPKKAFCSQLCPEAAAYVSQDHQRAREFFSFPEAKYSLHSEELDRLPSLSKTEGKIVTFLKKVSPANNAAKSWKFPAPICGASSRKINEKVTLSARILAKGNGYWMG